MRRTFHRLLPLVAGGLLALPSVATAASTPTGSLGAARTQAAGVALPGGATTTSVLVTGGRNGPGAAINSTERYSVAGGTWAPGPQMPRTRADHHTFLLPVSAALPNGGVVVIGGRGVTPGVGGEVDLVQADVLDPDTNVWDPGLATRSTARNADAAALVSVGGAPRVIVSGGQTGTPTTVATVDSYDPIADAWTVVAPLLDARREHASVTLPDGRVLVAGGLNANGAVLNTTELYDPATNVWTAGPPLSTPRAQFTLSVVDGTHVVATGGVADATGTPLATSESFDPTTNGPWTDAGTLAVGRYDHAATVLRSGVLVVTGGRGAGATGGLDSAESWTPANRWGGIYNVPGSTSIGGTRLFHVAAAIPQSDEVLVAGGGIPAALVPGTVTNTAARWRPDVPPVVVSPSTPPTTPPATTPLVPTTPITQPPPPAPPVPVQNQSVVATPVSGTVFIRIGTTDQYRPLEVGEALPVGTVIDATDGRVRITSAIGRGRQSAEFFGGTFTILQPKNAAGYVELRLFGKPVCGTAKAATRSGEQAATRLAQKAVKRKAKPRVWGDGKGKFRTRGKHSSASVRGTRWLVEERCTGTYTRVARGKVSVRDFVRHRNVLVKAPKSYLARPR